MARDVPHHCVGGKSSVARMVSGRDAVGIFLEISDSEEAESCHSAESDSGDRMLFSAPIEDAEHSEEGHCPEVKPAGPGKQLFLQQRQCRQSTTDGEKADFEEDEEKLSSSSSVSHCRCLTTSRLSMGNMT